MRKGSKDAFTSRRYRELMQNTSFECYRQIDPNPSEDVAISPHHHAFYEIIFVMSGDFFYEVEGRPYHLSKGDVILIDELQFHHGQIYHSQGYERYALWIHPQYMQRLAQRFPKLDPQYCFLQLNSENNNLIHLDDASFAELSVDLSHLFDSFWSKMPSDEVLSESYFAIILTRLNQIVHRQHSDEEIPTISASEHLPDNLFTQEHFRLQSLDALTAHYEQFAHGVAPLPQEAALPLPTTDARDKSAPQGSLEGLTPSYGAHRAQVVKQALLSSLEAAPLPPQSTWDLNSGPFMKGIAPSASGYQPPQGLLKAQPNEPHTAPSDLGYGTLKLAAATLYAQAPSATSATGADPDRTTCLSGAFEFTPAPAPGPYVGHALGFRLNEASLNPFVISIASPHLAIFSTWLNADVQPATAQRECNLGFSPEQLLIARNATWAAMQQLDERASPAHPAKLRTSPVPTEACAHLEGCAHLERSAVGTQPEALPTPLLDSLLLGNVPLPRAVSDANAPQSLSLNFSGDSYQIMELSLAFEDDLELGTNPAPLAPQEQGDDPSEAHRTAPDQDGAVPAARAPSAASGQAALAEQADQAEHAVLGATIAFNQERFNHLTAEIATQAPALEEQDDDEMHLNLKLSESLKLSAILKYINQNINENLSLDELAQRFSLSKFYLTRRFKELTGLSLHQFIVKKRLTRARYLISVGVDPYRAAVDAGFNNYSHFSRTFKSYFGQNPSSIPKAHTIHVSAPRAKR